MELSPPQIPPWALTALTGLGFGSAALALSSAASVAWLFLRPSSLPSALHPSGQKYLTYALVTGSTDGIGRALAFELSRRGFALVLHGRNPAKLRALSDELSASYGAQGAPEPKLLVADADKCAKIDFAALVEPLQRLRLTLLVNNVGAMGHMVGDPFKPLSRWGRSDLDRIVDLNAIFMAQLTRALLPLLMRSSDPAVPDEAFEYPVPLSRQPRRAAQGKAPRAHIINESSAAKLGVPYVTAYAGSKGFVEAFTAALKAELAAERIHPPLFPASLWATHAGPCVDVLALRIGSVVTNTNPVPSTIWAPSADTCASAILDRVGCGYDCTEAYFGHWVQVAFFMGLVEATLGQWARRLGIVLNMRWVREQRDTVAKKE